MSHAVHVYSQRITVIVHVIPVIRSSPDTIVLPFFFMTRSRSTKDTENTVNPKAFYKIQFLAFPRGKSQNSEPAIKLLNNPFVIN